MKKMLKNKKINSKNAVSGLVSTILLLGILVAIFSLLYIIVLSEPFESNDIDPLLITTIEGDQIVFEHSGGDSLTKNDEIRLYIGDKTEKFNVGDYLNLIDINNNGKWDISETLKYKFNYSLDVSEASFEAYDINNDGSHLISSGIIDIYPESDIAIEIDVDNKNPKIGDFINITIKVINYHGHNATNIDIDFKLPDSLYYIEHFSSENNYDNDSGIWHINGPILPRKSVELRIKVKVIATERSGVPTQLAMILDGSGSISGSDWNLMKDGLANAIENESVFPRDGSVELTIVQFGGNFWDHNFDEDYSNWIQTSYYERSGYFCARSDYNHDGNFISDTIDLSGANSATLEFYCRYHNTEYFDLTLSFYTGSEYIRIDELGDGAHNTWHKYTYQITDPQYLNSNFKIKFFSNLKNNEYLWIDDLSITKDGVIIIEDGFEAVGKAITEIGPINVTNDSADTGYYLTVSDQIRNIDQLEESTPLASGIRLATDELMNSDSFNSDKRKVINIVTDGMPNCVHIPDTYKGIWHNDAVEGFLPGMNSAENARDDMIDLLELNSEDDEIDSLAVGVRGMYGSPNISWLNESIVWPQPGHIAPPYDTSGWVSPIEIWEEFEDAIKNMFTYQFQSIISQGKIISLDARDPNSENNNYQIKIMPKS